MPDVTEELQQSEQNSEASAPTDFGANFKDLPADRIEELNNLVTTFNSKRDLWGRMVEIIRCTLRRYFWLGIQHGFWNADSQQLQIGPQGGAIENLNEEDLFAGDFNIYTQNGKIFISVFAQNAAASRMEPDKPGDSASVQAAQEAEKYVKVYQKYNPPQVAQQEVGRLMWTDGRIIAVTDYEEDSDLLGEEEDEEGNPVPRGTEITKYYGVLESKVPLIEPFSKWPYCKVSTEIDILTAKHDNPDFASQIQTGAKGLVPNDEIARMSRIATAENIAQVSSDTLAHLVTEDIWWLRPSAFRDLPDDRQAFWIGGESKSEDGQVIKSKGLFPQGCRVKFFGSVFAGAKAVAMNRQVRCMHAMPGTGNSRPSLSDALIPIQMEYNDAVGMYSEMLHKCIPRMWVNAGPDEIQAILEQVSRYGEISPFTNPSTGQPLEQNFFVEPQIDVPASAPAWMENLQGPLSQFVTGNSPALFGQQMEDQKTATGYAQARDQSLGLMSLVWVPYLQFAASIRGQAARCAGERDADEISAVIPDQQGADQTLAVKVALLKAGGFISTPVTDQNFPESWVQTSNTIKQLLAAAPTNPILAKTLTLPGNLKLIRDAIGVDLEIDGEDSMDLQLAEWAKMQQGDGPIPDEQATAQRDQQKQQAAQAAVNQLAPGQSAPQLPAEPPVMASTVPIDPETDDHVVHALTMFQILNSPDGQKVKESNPQVWEDGKLHMLAHVAAAQKKGLVIPPPLGGAPPPIPPPAAGSPVPKPPVLPNPQGATNVSTSAPAA